MSYARSLVRTLLYVAFNVLIAGAVIELVFVVLLWSPRTTAHAPVALQRLAQQVYRHFSRSLVQFDAHCARYDPEVTYTLRPGSCTFANAEFSTRLEINSAGVRDDAASLDAPEIIVLGDSHAMGWGVQQDENFPAVIESVTHRRVLNAGISSYGTVREVMLLGRLDTSRLRAIVLQYSDNDVIENATFSDDHNHLPITPEARYDDIVRYYASQGRYYPGKYVIRLFLKLTHLETPEPVDLAMAPVTMAQEATLFLNALTHAGHLPANVPILVLEVNQNIEHTRLFAAALADAVRTPPTGTRVIPFDASTVLRPELFYVLDDHMTARGHKALGEALAAAVQAF